MDLQSRLAERNARAQRALKDYGFGHVFIHGFVEGYGISGYAELDVVAAELLTLAIPELGTWRPLFGDVLEVSGTSSSKISLSWDPKEETTRLSIPRSLIRTDGPVALSQAIRHACENISSPSRRAREFVDSAPPFTPATTLQAVRDSIGGMEKMENELRSLGVVGVLSSYSSMSEYQLGRIKRAFAAHKEGLQRHLAVPVLVVPAKRGERPRALLRNGAFLVSYQEESHEDNLSTVIGRMLADIKAVRGER
jgi:hypothetical protein